MFQKIIVTISAVCSLLNFVYRYWFTRNVMRIE